MTRVALVVARELSVTLEFLARDAHVWVVGTPAHRRAAMRFWAERPATDDASLTTFLPGETPEDEVLGILWAIDDHHGLRAEWNDEVELTVYGVALTPAIREALETFGPFSFQDAHRGWFVARRSPPFARVDDPTPARLWEIVDGLAAQGEVTFTFKLLVGPPPWFGTIASTDAVRAKLRSFAVAQDRWLLTEKSRAALVRLFPEGLLQYPNAGVEDPVFFRNGRSALEIVSHEGWAFVAAGASGDTASR